MIGYMVSFSCNFLCFMHSQIEHIFSVLCILRIVCGVSSKRCDSSKCNHTGTGYRVYRADRIYRHLKNSGMIDGMMHASHQHRVRQHQMDDWAGSQSVRRLQAEIELIHGIVMIRVIK